MLLEEANQTLIDNRIFEAMFTNGDLSEENLQTLSKWGNQAMTKEEVIKMLDILQLQILPIG